MILDKLTSKLVTTNHKKYSMPLRLSTTKTTSMPTKPKARRSSLAAAGTSSSSSSMVAPPADVVAPIIPTPTTRKKGAAQPRSSFVSSALLAAPEPSLNIPTTNKKDKENGNDVKSSATRGRSGGRINGGTSKLNLVAQNGVQGTVKAIGKAGRGTAKAGRVVGKGTVIVGKGTVMVSFLFSSLLVNKSTL